MGNSSKSKPLTTTSAAENNNNNPTDETMMDDFEPIDKPASPTWMSSFVSLSSTNAAASTTTTAASPANDLATSGILVEAPTTTNTTTGSSSRSSSEASTSKMGRRVVKASPPPPREPTTTTRPTTTTSTTSSNKKKKDEEEDHHDHALPKTAQSDDELLQESLDKEKERRLLRLQRVQKSKRQTHVMARRREVDGGASANKATANPFSRFLSVFSVEPSFPSHKRPYEPSPSELLDDDDDKEDKKNQTATTADRKHYVLEAKRAKIDPSAAANDDNDDAKQSVLATILLSQWEAVRRNLPDDWLWMVGVAATSLLTIGLLTTFAQHTKLTTTLSSSRRSW